MKSCGKTPIPVLRNVQESEVADEMAAFPRWLCGTSGTVVGLGRTRIRVRFDDYSYDNAEGFHTIGPYVRRLGA